jgi:hypothetical protein
MTNSRFAGELLVAAELCRLGLTVALHNTFGVNTPAFDMVVHDAAGASRPIQVKSLKAPNAFLIDPEAIRAEAGYVFVVVGEAGTLPSFHVARGAQILAQEEFLFGKWGRTYAKKHGRGIPSTRLPKAWLNGWHHLGLDTSV